MKKTKIDKKMKAKGRYNYKKTKRKKITVEHTMAYQKTHCVLFICFFWIARRERTI